MATEAEHLGLAAFASAALALAVLAGPAWGEDLTGMLDGPGVVIHYATGAEKWARLAVRHFPVANRQALDTLGMTTNRKVIIHLYATTRGFRQATNYLPPDTLGVAYPSRILIVIDCCKAEPSGNNSFPLTLNHEMIHIGFGRLAARTGRDVPLWFNEGVACWSMGRLHTGDPRQLVRAANTDSLLPLRRLTRSFPHLKTMRELAYQQSEDAVRFLVNEYDPESIKRIVAGMDGGLTFDQALADVIGDIDFEAEWRKHVRRQYPLLALLRNFFSLFTILALFVIFAYGLYRIRRRRVKRRWREEEEYEDTWPL